MRRYVNAALAAAGGVAILAYAASAQAPVEYPGNAKRSGGADSGKTRSGSGDGAGTGKGVASGNQNPGGAQIYNGSKIVKDFSNINCADCHSGTTPARQSFRFKLHRQRVPSKFRVGN
ncbi:MAG: hypothetical protein R3D45_10930 [Rhizobiaceae bacterium]